MSSSLCLSLSAYANCPVEMGGSSDSKYRVGLSTTRPSFCTKLRLRSPSMKDQKMLCHLKRDRYNESFPGWEKE